MSRMEQQHHRSPGLAEIIELDLSAESAKLRGRFGAPGGSDDQRRMAPFQLTRQHILNCSFSQWYPRFKRHTPKARLVLLPPEFRAYLESDGVFLPDGSGNDDDDISDPDGSDLEVERRWTFPDLDARIRQVIDEFDGAVFPKLNWSSPQDAAWVSADQSLLCRSPADIYLLFKSSDFVAHDLEHAFDECIDQESEHPENLPLQLVLRKWFEMPRSNEFRCFVKEGKLIAISSRDINYYAFLQSSAFREQLVQRISDFFLEVVSPNFPDSHFTFDVYLTRTFDRTFLVDFNPWAKQTDSLLFSWEELRHMTPSEPLLRIVTSEMQASQSRPRYALNSMPKDVTQLAAGQTISEFQNTWQQALAEAVADQTEPRDDIGR